MALDVLEEVAVVFAVVDTVDIVVVEVENVVIVITVDGVV